VVVPGRPIKGANARVDSSAPVPNKKRPCKRVKREAGKGVPRISPHVKSPGGEDVTVDNTAGGHLEAHPAEPNMPSGTLKSTAKNTGTAPVRAASKEAAPRRTSPEITGNVSGPKGATVNITQA
jgi:hypothetical protein